MQWCVCWLEEGSMWDDAHLCIPSLLQDFIVFLQDFIVFLQDLRDFC